MSTDLRWMDGEEHVAQQEDEWDEECDVTREVSCDEERGNDCKVYLTTTNMIMKR